MQSPQGASAKLDISGSLTSQIGTFLALNNFRLACDPGAIARAAAEPRPRFANEENTA